MDYMNGPGRNHLFVPGPVNIPDQVIRAMSRQNEDYRSPAIPALTKTLLEDVKKIFKTTTGTPFLFPTTGTGAWESALTNTLSPGDRIVSFSLGQFSLLWIDQQQRLGFSVDVVESDWGYGADLGVLESKLRTDSQHTIKAICIVHNETATGVTNDLHAVRKLLDAYRHPALLLVDGVSSICALDFRMDEWGVDVALTGSQKALSLPTGLGIVCASPKALEAAKTAKSVRVFFDWKDYLKFYKMGTYWPYTPSIQLLYGLRAGLDLLFEEGLDNVIKRHTRLGTATRLAVAAWGLKNCTEKEENFSDTVTAVVVPPYIDSSEIVKHAWKRYNLSLGLGLNKVAAGGRVFATDVSEVAVEVARLNVQRYGVQDKVEIRHGSWFEPLEDVKGKLMGVISNPPYIPTDDLPGLQPEVGWHEPKLALDGGKDGLDHLLHLCEGLSSALMPGGFFVFETNGNKQSEFLVDFISTKWSSSFCDVEAVLDFADIKRFVRGYRR